MNNWLEEVFNLDPGFARGLQFVIALLIVLGLIAVFIWIMRRISGGGMGRVPRNRQPRIAVMDHAALDARRRLILIRRDNIEHLLLVGGPSDVVVEQNIVRVQPASGYSRPGNHHQPQVHQQQPTAQPTISQPPAASQPTSHQAPVHQPSSQPIATGDMPTPMRTQPPIQPHRQPTPQVMPLHPADQTAQRAPQPARAEPHAPAAGNAPTQPSHATQPATPRTRATPRSPLPPLMRRLLKPRPLPAAWRAQVRRSQARHRPLPGSATP